MELDRKQVLSALLAVHGWLNDISPVILQDVLDDNELIESVDIDGDMDIVIPDLIRQKMELREIHRLHPFTILNK